MPRHKLFIIWFVGSCAMVMAALFLTMANIKVPAGMTWIGPTISFSWLGLWFLADHFYGYRPDPMAGNAPKGKIEKEIYLGVKMQFIRVDEETMKANIITLTPKDKVEMASTLPGIAALMAQYCLVATDGVEASLEQLHDACLGCLRLQGKGHEEECDPE